MLDNLLAAIIVGIVGAVVVTSVIYALVWVIYTLYKLNLFA